MNWHVCTTGINQEQLAYSGLLAKGFEVYLPIGRRIVRHGRQTKEKIFPVISRYIFVKFDVTDPEYSEPIRSTDGIIDILCNNWHPVPVPEDKICELQKREQAGEFNIVPPKRKQPQWARSFEILKSLLVVT